MFEKILKSIFTDSSQRILFPDSSRNTLSYIGQVTGMLPRYGQKCIIINTPVIPINTCGST